MYKQVAILFIAFGVAIAVYAITAADSFPDDVKEFFQHLLTYRSVLLTAAGLIMCAIGIAGLVRDRSEHKRPEE